MRKYVDITINDAMERKIYEALDTIKVEEIIIFLKQYNIDDFKYHSKDFINILSILYKGLHQGATSIYCKRVLFCEE